MRHRILESFTGPFAIIEHDGGRLTTSWLNAETRLLLSGSRQDRTLAPRLARRLGDYFSGKSVDFADVLTPSGSEFFVRCWQACRRIKRGQTRTYGDLAAMAGSTPAAARAAGQAMRHNPLPIIIPCHRVIGSTGRLHGFGGTANHSSMELKIKAALLRMEGALDDPPVVARRTTARKVRVLSAA